MTGGFFYSRMSSQVRLVFFVFYFGLLSVLSPGQNFKASAKLDTNVMLIGDQVKFELNFTASAKTQVRWPMIGDTILSSIQVIKRTKIDTSYSKDKSSVNYHQDFLLTSFDSGFFPIPPVKIYYRQLPDTTVRFEQTETLLLKVHTMAVDTTKAIKPIKGPMKVPLTFREFLPWILLGILIILLVLGLIYYLKKHRIAEPVFQIRPRVQLQPYEIALSELEKLRVRKLWQEGKVKQYHSELTDIIRRYIEGKIGILAMEMTSSEIMGLLKGNPVIPVEAHEKLSYILPLADMVKFAKMQPLPAENEISLDQAIAFVNTTALTKEEGVINV